jgi:hypothetical protein
MTEDRFQELIEDYLDGELAENDFRELKETLGDDPVLAKTFDGEIRMAGHLAVVGNFDDAVLPGAVLASLKEPEPPIDVTDLVLDELRHRHAPWSWKAVLPWAAMIVISLGIAIFWSQPKPVPPGPIAVLGRTIDARWNTGTTPVDGAELNGQTIELKSGLIRLDFLNGVVVTLEGPARFELITKKHTILHSGILTAIVPPAGHGFRVDTPAAGVVDLGTAFGVVVDARGGTDVSVFEGEVEIDLATAGREDRLLKEGESVHASGGAQEFNDVPFDTAAFQRSWPVASGVMAMTGAVQFVRPGPPWNLEDYESDRAITVFPEHDRATLTASLRVELAEPDLEMVGAKTNRRRLVAGTTLRSYLLQFNPAPRGKSEGVLHLSGTITFDHPVLGVLAGKSNLPGTDEIFGHAQSRYGRGKRGMEGPRQDASSQQSDRAALSPDRRTLTLELFSRSEPDQIRVLVEVEDSRE